MDTRPHRMRREAAKAAKLALEHVVRVEAKLRSMRDAILHLAERCHGDDRPECRPEADA